MYGAEGIGSRTCRAGPLGGVASTVVDFNAAPPKVVRCGVVDDLTEFGLGHA